MAVTKFNVDDTVWIMDKNYPTKTKINSIEINHRGTLYGCKNKAYKWENEVGRSKEELMYIIF